MEETNWNEDKMSSLSSTDPDYVKFLQDSLIYLMDICQDLKSEMKHLHEDNKIIKTEIKILRKELEVATSVGQFKEEQISFNNHGTEGKNWLINSLSFGNLFKIPNDELKSFSKDSNENLKNFLASLKYRHLWIGLVIILVVIGLAVSPFLLHSTTEDQGWDTNLSENTTLTLYSREEWQAQPSRGNIKPLKQNPPEYVIVAHTGGRNCTTFPTCSQAVRDTQFDQMGRGWSDMGMHFLVGGDGAAYTGLGWGKYGSHTIPFNGRSISIYFMGTFMFYLPPRRQINAAKLLIEEGVKLGKIAKNYKVFAHKQVWPTESPGAALIQEIMTWPHWAPYELSDKLA